MTVLGQLHVINMLRDKYELFHSLYIFLTSVDISYSDYTTFKIGYVSNVSDVEFCKDEYNCHKRYLHTICQHKCQMEPNCDDFQSWELDNSRRQYILDLHNFYRNLVAVGNETRGEGLPPAKNMRTLNYQVLHEPVVHCWMRRCKSEHDFCRGIKKEYLVGQNMFESVGPKSRSYLYKDGFTLINESIFTWYEEVLFMRLNDVASYNPDNSDKFGQASQLLWAESFNVGCGFSRHEHPNMPDSHIWLFFCNYGPAGNLQGRPIYSAGEPASACPSGLHPDVEYSNLCGDMYHISSIRKPVITGMDYSPMEKGMKPNTFLVVTSPPSLSNTRWHHSFLLSLIETILICCVCNFVRE